MLMLARSVEYNSWANARVLAVCAGLDAATLAGAASGSVGSIEATLKHLIGVEDGYLAMLSGSPPDSTADRGAYLAQDLRWFLARWPQLADGYAELVVNEDEAALARAAVVPWIAAPLTRLDQYLQVLSHSTHHRAQVLSILGSRRLQVPDLDYVFLLQERAAAP